MDNVFDAPRDASMRLDKIIVFYLGIPHLCVKGENDLSNEHPTRVSITRIDKYNRNVKWTKVDYTNDAFTVGFPDIGYVNFKTDVFYGQTYPLRSQKWGWCASSINMLDRLGTNIGRVSSTAIYSKPMLDALTDYYPSVKDALKKVSVEYVSSCAFHKEFAIVKKGGVLNVYSGGDQRIGTINRIGVIKLDKTVPGYEYTHKLLSSVLENKGGSIYEEH